MKVGDVVAWNPTRAAAYPQKVKFVGVVTEVVPASRIDYGPAEGHVYVIWNESTIPTLNDPRDVKVIETTNESR
tara:strand:- start:736 stop:957 length:222 start_codon:yes stop_codon:yes gene_type:complete